MTGGVALVGAGPGDPGLMTVRGLAILRKAQVVVYDRLIDPRLLDEAPPRALRVFVGKASGAHTLPQARDQRAAGRARPPGPAGGPAQGGRSVRVRPGRGRGRSAGGRRHSVRGGSRRQPAVAAPAAAGIPVTHRAVASSFAVVTGHEDDRKSVSRVDWARLATAVDTLVILMGLENLPRIARALRQAGRAAETPAAVIERGATTGQRVVVGRLDTIATRVAAAECGRPRSSSWETSWRCGRGFSGLPPTAQARSE